MCHSMGNETGVWHHLGPHPQDAALALHSHGETGDPARGGGVVAENETEKSLKQTLIHAEAGVQGHNRSGADHPQHGAGNAPELITPAFGGQGSGGNSRVQA